MSHEAFLFCVGTSFLPQLHAAQHLSRILVNDASWCCGVGNGCRRYFHSVGRISQQMAPMVLLSARAPSANGGGRRLAQVGQAVSRRWCQGHLHRQFGCGGSVVDAFLYEACASWKSKSVKLLWRGSAVFVVIAALSWAWRWSGRLLGSQGSGGRVRFCTPCGASGDAAGAVQKAPAALERVGTTPARRVHAEPNMVVSWGKEEFGDEDDASFVVFAWPLRVTTCQRSALLGGRCSHGQALPALVARGPLTKTGKLQDTH